MTSNLVVSKMKEAQCLKQQSHATRQAVHTSQPEIFATTTPHNT